MNDGSKEEMKREVFRNSCVGKLTQFTSAQLKEYCRNHGEEGAAEVAVREKMVYAEEGVDE